MRIEEGSLFTECSYQLSLDTSYPVNAFWTRLVSSLIIGPDECWPPTYAKPKRASVATTSNFRTSTLHNARIPPYQSSSWLLPPRPLCPLSGPIPTIPYVCPTAYMFIANRLLQLIDSDPYDLPRTLPPCLARHLQWL